LAPLCLSSHTQKKRYKRSITQLLSHSSGFRVDEMCCCQWQTMDPAVSLSNGCADSTKRRSNNGTFAQQIIWVKQQSEKQTVGLFVPVFGVSCQSTTQQKNREKATNDSFHQQSLGKKYKIWFNQGSYLFLLAKTLRITFSQVHYLFLLCMVTVTTCS